MSKKKIDYDLLAEVGDSAPVEEKEDKKELPTEPIKQIKKKPTKTGDTKQKLIFIPREWEEAIKVEYGNKFSFSSYIIQALREKLSNDKII